MHSEDVVVLNNVSESYGIDFIIDGKTRHEEILAVNQVSLTIKRGECVAILGANGAGKSTILKLIADILRPDRGDIKVNGRVTCLLDLGVGFDPNLTGRENIFLLAKLYGIKKEQIQPKLERIIEFSGIGRFIDAPLKCYSAGMYVRLAFSLAIHVDPDILLIDDCLIVGDENFQKRCIEKIFELKQASKTIIFVTHDTNLASMLARRGIFIKDGQVLYDGSIEKAFIYYTQMVGDINGIGSLDRDNLSLIFNNGKLYLNWKNMPLSKSFGGSITLQTPTGQLFSKDMHWRIESQDAGSLVAKGLNMDLGLKQIWEIKLIEGNCIEWQIETRAPADSRFFLTQINLMLNEKFNRWSTLDNEGVFPQKFSSFREWQVLESIKSDSDASGVIGAYYEGSDSALLPGVSLESNYDSNFRIARAIITGFEQSAVVLSLRASTPGAQNHFSGRIKVFENKQELYNYLAFRRLNFIKERTIQEGNTRLFFDGKRLRLFYKEFELTKANCFLSSFYYRDRWLNSSEAVWEIKKQNTRTLILNAHWPELKISQIWEISLLGEFEVIWKIKLETKEGIDMLSSRNAIFLSDRYSHWFSSYEEGAFPQEFLGQDIVLENNKRKTAGIKNAYSYPGIMFDVSEDLNNSLPVIQNSDALYQARVIYAVNTYQKKKDSITYPRGSYGYFSGKIKICPEAKSIEEYLAVSKKDKLDEDLRLQVDTIEANTIQDGATKIIFDSGALRIFYHELEVTEGAGIRTIFDVYNINKQLDSDNARWQINKVSDSRITCYLQWDHISYIFQKWDVAIENNVVKLLMTMSSRDNINIYNEHIGLLLSKNYKRCLTATGEERDVNYDFTGKNKGLSIKNNKSKLFYVRKYTQIGTVYPDIIFNSLLDNTPEIVSISLDKDNGLGMYFLKVDQREALSKTPGEYVYFKGEIILDKELQKNKNIPESITQHPFNLPILKPLELLFANGTLKLFWKKKEVTKGLGVYTSFSSNGQWYDSSQAIWQIDSAESNTLRVTGIWPWIPVIQSWHIKADKRSIFLDINNEIYRKVYLDAEETNLFLINEYRRWFVGKKKGYFYEEFSQSDVFRFRVWVSKLRDEKTGVAGLKKKFFSLPYVSLRSLNKNENTYLVIENANILGENGRLIQYLNINKEEASLKEPCKYNLFKGMIELKVWG